MDTRELTQDMGECKSLSTAKSDDEGLWYKRYPGRFLKATMDMPFDLRAAYALFIDYYFFRGGPLINDDSSVARGMGCDVRKWKHIRKQLFVLGKIKLGKDNLIHNGFADEILKERSTKLSSDRRSKKSKAPVALATPASTTPSTDASTTPSTDASTTPDLEKKLNDIKEAPQKVPLHARASIKIEERESKKETTTPEPDLVVAATFAGEVLTPELRSRFYSIATKFGVKAGAITFPPSREESDALLRELVAISLADADDMTMARTAFANALTALQASDMTARASGWEGRYHGGGIPAAIKYLSKCLPDKLADVRLAQAVARAKAITEEAVQKKIAEKRLNGVGHGRQSAQSWEEAAATLQ